MKEYKECKICHQSKHINEFRKQEKGKLKRKSYCVLCDDEYNRNRYRKNSEYIKLQSLNWAENHPNQVKQYKKKWRNKNKERN